MARSILRFAVMLSGLLLAYAGQYLLDGPERYSRWLTLVPPTLQQSSGALALLLLGALLFAVAAPALARADEPLNAPRAFHDHPTPAARPLFVLAVLSYLLSVTLWLARGENVLVRGLWLLGILSLLGSQLPVASPARLRPWGQRNWRRAGLPALLLALAAALRLYRLPELPQDLHGDMASHGLQALALLDGRALRVVALGWADIPITGFLPTALAMRLTGDYGLLGLALPSVIGGVLSVAGLYVWLNELLGRRTALIGSALLAVSYTHIHFSRIAEYMDPVPFIVWTLAFLVIGLRRGRSLPFVLSGFMLAGAGLMYYAGRIAWVLTPLTLLTLLLADRAQLRANRRGLVWLGMAAAIALGPMLGLLLQQPEGWLTRTREVWLFNPPVMEHSLHKYGVATTAQVLAEQLRRSLLLFNSVPDSSMQFGFPRPALDALSAPLVVAGGLYALLRPRQWRSALLLWTLLAALLLGSVLTDNPPFWPRLVFVLLPALGLAALAVDRLWAGALHAFGSETQRLLSLLAVVGLLCVGLLNWTLYYQFALSNGSSRALLGRVVSRMPTTTAALCIVPDDDTGWIHGVNEREIAFFMGQRTGVSVPLVEEGPDTWPLPCTQTGAVWVIPTPRQSVLPQLMQRFPGATLTPYGRRAGETAFYTLVVR